MTKYRSVVPLATLLTALVVVIVGSSLASAVFTYLWHFQAPEEATRHLLARIDDERLTLARPVIYAAMTATFVFVFIASRNLGVIGPARPTFSPGMAVAWFFIPIGNIFMVHQVLTALWRESQPLPSQRLRRGLDFSAPWVTAWWVVLSVGLVVSFVLGREHLTEPWGHVARTWAHVAFNLVLGACFLVVVRGIAGRQREQWLDLERRRAVPQPTANALR